MDENAQGHIMSQTSYYYHICSVNFFLPTTVTDLYSMPHIAHDLSYLCFSHSEHIYIWLHPPNTTALLVTFSQI